MSPAMKTPEMTAVVKLPPLEAHSAFQTVVGKISSISPDLEEFRGLPYGIIPGRWQHSQLRTRLPQDIFDATGNGPKCPQPSAPNDTRTYQSYLPFPSDVVESEFDCLNLFIVRPSVAALRRCGVDVHTTKLPVLMWIHGGGWAFGAATDPIWDPSRLVLRSLTNGTPIIAVCVNYRLNVFGFGASSEILQSQGPVDVTGLNFGLRDQKVALTWISRNIAAFGGDPGKITLGGQSAGSVSVHAHLLEANDSPDEPLFRRVIMHSGAFGTLGPASIQDANELWDNLCKYWALDSEPAVNRVELLRRIPAQDLLKSIENLGVETFPAIMDNITFCPGNGLDGGVHVNLGPVDLRRTPRQSQNPPMDVLAGVTDTEAIIFQQFALNWDQLHSVFEAAYMDSNLRLEVMQAYGLTETASAEELRKGIVTFLSDSLFEAPVHHLRQSLSVSSRSLAALRLRLFHVSIGNPFQGPLHGTSHHCVDLIYLFEAFHDALVDADRGIAVSYHEPGALAAHANTRGTCRANMDSGLGSPASQDEEPLSKLESSGVERGANISMCHRVQDDWLDYIVNDDSGYARHNPADITVYGSANSKTVHNMDEDPIWKSRANRRELASQNFEAMVRIRDGLRKL